MNIYIETPPNKNYQKPNPLLSLVLYYLILHIPTSPSVANCRRFYAHLKVHKPDIPFRPIVSDIGKASYLLVQYLTTLFSPHLYANLYTVKNSIMLAKIIQNLSLFKFIMVSSLFKNVPINGILCCLEQRLHKFYYLYF